MLFNLHLKVLIAILLTLGVAITAYQISSRVFPLPKPKTDDLWNTMLVDFVATPKTPVKVQMFVPPLSQDYVSLNESFVSNNYGVSINRADGNRRPGPPAALTASRPCYRLVLTSATPARRPRRKARSSATACPLEGPEKIAAEALLAPIRQHSADVETFVSEAIKRANNGNDDNVKLLDGRRHQPGKESAYRRNPCCPSLTCRWRRVHTIRLVADPQQSPELRLRSFNGENWLYFNVVTGEQGLPSDRPDLVVWR